MQPDTQIGRARSCSPPGLANFCTVHADYGFEYSDEEVQEEDVDIENQYYNSKGERLESKRVQQVPVVELTCPCPPVMPSAGMAGILSACACSLD